MREFRLREDLTRAVVGSFALPLGIEPIDLPTPAQGYTLQYEPGEDGEPDSYSFHIVVSHDRLSGVIAAAFTLLTDEVLPVVEIGSRDAYRTVDTYVSREPIRLDEFLSVWTRYEPVLLEDASLGAGASCEDPPVEVFLDSWKGLSIHVAIEMRKEVQALLGELGLREVLTTWPDEIECRPDPPSNMREVLAIEDGQSPDIDEILLQLRDWWMLELDVDPDENLDEDGRRLGSVLWHAIAMCAHTADTHRGAYITFWITAASMAEVEDLVSAQIEVMDDWDYQGFYSIDRVAFDERPEDLVDLPLRRSTSTVHSQRIDEW
ncbi:MAG: hypothetical protein EXS00_02390 [Phycisphaerales bacterium]|nr:hypothetical protein [Phycisphaerales bacterium]